MIGTDVATEETMSIIEIIVMELIIEVKMTKPVIEVQVGTIEDHHKNPVRAVKAKTPFEAGKVRVV